MSQRRQAQGRRAEAAVVARLKDAGWTILATNWRRPDGELDAVARDGDWLVFVEVRSRIGRAFGPPQASLDVRKRRRLIRLGTRYVQESGWTGPWRIDLVAVTWPDGPHNDPTIDHIRNAVTP